MFMAVRQAQRGSPRMAQVLKVKCPQGASNLVGRRVSFYKGLAFACASSLLEGLAGHEARKYEGALKNASGTWKRGQGQAVPASDLGRGSALYLDQSGPRAYSSCAECLHAILPGGTMGPQSVY